jgi:hypothetical protein
MGMGIGGGAGENVVLNWIDCMIICSLIGGDSTHGWI